MILGFRCWYTFKNSSHFSFREWFGFSNRLIKFSKCSFYFIFIILIFSLVLIVIGCIIKIAIKELESDSLRIFLAISYDCANYFLLILVMFLITLFNFLVIKILGSPKKNIEIEKNLEQNTSKQ